MLRKRFDLRHLAPAAFVGISFDAALFLLSVFGAVPDVVGFLTLPVLPLLFCLLFIGAAGRSAREAAARCHRHLGDGRAGLSAGPVLSCRGRSAVLS